MSGKFSRDKGQRAEREVCRMIYDYLGIEAKRNLSQTRDAGCDCLTVPGWAVEVKYQETESLNAWWAQSVKQADMAGLDPVLFYRASRRPWRVCVDMHSISASTYPTPGQYQAVIEPDAWFQLVREGL